jgi:hypothetical protein
LASDPTSLVETREEAKGAVAAFRKLPIRDEVLSLQSDGAGDNLREEPVERFLLLGLEIDLVAVPEGEAAEAVIFRLHLLPRGNSSTGSASVGLSVKGVAAVGLLTQILVRLYLYFYSSHPP